MNATRLTPALVLMFLLLGSVAGAQQQPTSPSPAAVDVGQKSNFFTTKDGVKIHYQTHGDRGLEG